MHKIRLIISLVIFGLTVSCSTSPTGRRQLTLLPADQMNAMGTQAFDEMKKTQPIETDPAINNYVQCIVAPLVKNLDMKDAPATWEVVVFRSKDVNAFALPGGKIGVYTGLLNVANTPDQLAAVIGHEIAHVTANHGNARVSETLLATTGLQAAGAIMSQKQGKNYNLLMSAIGLGAQFGILMPHSRSQETEADLLGLELMAKAGFDPHQAVTLWQNMEKASTGAPPEFLSTHPAPASRIKNIENHMSKALAAKGPMPQALACRQR